MTVTRNGTARHDEHDDAVVGYCFGDLDAQQRENFELHLLTCEVCFKEVERLIDGVAVLRADRRASTEALTRTEVVGLLGISWAAGERLAGHLWYVALVTTGCALLYAQALLTELSYFIDRHLVLATWAVPLVFIWIVLACMAAFVVTARLGQRGRPTALLWGSGTLVCFVALMLIVEQFVLPHEPTILAKLQPRTVVGANLRNTLIYGLPLALIFALVPFHFVVAIQRELAEGRHGHVLRILSGGPSVNAPRGAIYLTPYVLGGLILIAAIYLVVANNYLIDNLVPGEHSELFSNLIYLRIFGGLSFAGGCLMWYMRMLNEANREAAAMSQLDEPNGRS